MLKSSTLYEGTPEGLAQQMADLMLISFRAELQSFKESFATNTTDELLTKKEVCEYLKVTPTTLWRWEKAGKIETYGIGKNRYYKKDEILNLLTLLKK